MTRDEVIKALEYMVSGECCDTQYDFIDEIEFAIADMKAMKNNCWINTDFTGIGMDCARMYTDAIALLREQEPRVMTLDELTEIYVEFKGSACPVRLTNFDLQKIIMDVDDGICRLWTARPTDEQRKAVDWNA